MCMIFLLLFKSVEDLKQKIIFLCYENTVRSIKLSGIINDKVCDKFKISKIRISKRHLHVA